MAKIVFSHYESVNKMASIFSHGPSTQVLDFSGKKVRTESVLNAMVQSNGVMVLCGPGTLAASGIEVSLLFSTSDVFC